MKEHLLLLHTQSETILLCKRHACKKRNKKESRDAGTTASGLHTILHKCGKIEVAWILSLHFLDLQMGDSKLNIYYLLFLKWKRNYEAAIYFSLIKLFNYYDDDDDMET